MNQQILAVFIRDGFRPVAGLMLHSANILISPQVANDKDPFWDELPDNIEYLAEDRSPLSLYALESPTGSLRIVSVYEDGTLRQSQYQGTYCLHWDIEP